MTKPAHIRRTLQEWTFELCAEANIDTQCLLCKSDMVPGYAIDPKDIEDHDERCCRPRHPLHIVGRGTQRFEDIEMIYVLKCPKCGHSEKIDQEIFKVSGPPVGFTTWNQFWASPISVK